MRAVLVYVVLDNRTSPTSPLGDAVETFSSGSSGARTRSRFIEQVRRDEDASQLVHLYAERGSPKYERAVMRWLERYLTESEPRLEHFAEMTASLAKRAPEAAGLDADVRRKTS